MDLAVSIITSCELIETKYDKEEIIINPKYNKKYKLFTRLLIPLIKLFLFIKIKDVIIGLIIDNTKNWVAILSIEFK